MAWQAGPYGRGSCAAALYLASTLSLAALSVPLLYLVLRAAGIGPLALVEVVASAQGLRVLANSLLLAAGVALVSLLIALPMAILTARTDLPWRRFWTILGVLPLAVPSYVGSFAIIAAFAPRGSYLQVLLEPFGVEELPSIIGWPGAIAGIALFTYPYLLLTLRSGLFGINPATEEAARSLGLRRRDTILRVLLPQLRPALAAGMLLVALYSLRDLGTPALMRVDTFTRVIYLQYTLSFDRNRAAALAIMLAVTVMILLWVESRTRTRAAYWSRRGTARPQPVLRLGAWKWPSVLFCAAVASLTLALPIGVSLLWFTRGVRTGALGPLHWARTLEVTVNSLSLSGLTALAVVLFALPVAILAARAPGKLTASVERFAYVAFGLPGIVVALALVFASAQFLPVLYQTQVLLLFACFVLFFPQGLGAIRATLLQLNPQLEESAASLGYGPWRTFGSVTLPLAAPGLVTGALLVFLTAMKELPATLLLAPTGYDTLATRVWKATEDVYFAEAAVYSLAIVVVCAGLILAVIRRGGAAIPVDDVPQ
ncbi:MAG: iron ABC transporter permease [Bryobacterales bacterium]|nr:iron ABC transporter permease [Bryobacterales bacterium]